MNKLYFLTILTFSFSFLNAQNYEIINLTELYEKSNSYEKGWDFHPLKINNQEEMTGVIQINKQQGKHKGKHKKQRQKINSMLTFGAIQEGKLSLKSVNVVPTRKLFINDEGMILGEILAHNKHRLMRRAHGPIHNVKMFSWNPVTDNLIPFPKMNCRGKIVAKGIDATGNVLANCWLNRNRPVSLIWSPNNNTVSPIRAPFAFQAINDNGNLFHRGHPRNKPWKIFIYSQKNGKTTGYSTSQRRTQILGFNNSMHALMLSEKGGGKWQLSLWSPEKVIAIGVFKGHSEGLPGLFLNNKNQIIVRERGKYYLYQEGKASSLDELVHIPSLEIFRVLDFNDEGSLLLVGKMKGEKSPQYYLLRAFNITLPEITEEDMDFFFSPEEMLEEEWSEEDMEVITPEELENQYSPETPFPSMEELMEETDSSFDEKQWKDDWMEEYETPIELEDDPVGKDEEDSFWSVQ